MKVLGYKVHCTFYIVCLLFSLTFHQINGSDRRMILILYSQPVLE